MKPSYVSLILVVSLAGCGGSGDSTPKLSTVPVSGKVTLDGSSFGPGTIEFIPSEGEGGETRLASGTIDAEGAFTLGSYTEDDGAVPGNYHVRIAKDSAADPSAASGLVTEELTVTVPAEGSESLSVDLKSKSAGAGDTLMSPKLNSAPDTTSMPAKL